MTTQYTPILKLALPVTGELSGTWGDVVNDNITSMVEQAIAGLATISTWTGNSHTLTTANGTTSESRCAMLVAQDGAGLTAAGEIVCPASSKLYVLKNATSYTITLKTAAGTGVAVVSGNTAFLFCDGTNVNACVTTIVDGRVTGNLTVDGNATVNGNTTLGNATSDTITATARFASGLTPSADNTYDLGSTGNSWKDLYIDGTAYLALVDINGGTIDGVSIGASTAATIINVDNLRLDGNTISSTDTNGNVVIAPNGTGDVQLDADTVRVGDSGAAATLTSNGAGALTVTTGGAADLTLSTNSGTTSGTIVIANGAGGNITLTPEGTGDVILSADRVQIGDANTDTTLTTNGTGSLNLTTNNGTNSGTIQIAQGANGNITLTPNGTGSVSVPKLVWSNGTATRVPYLTTGGQFTDSANLTFNGTDLTVSGAVNAGTINATTLDLTNLEVTNIKAKDGTASITIADSTGAVSFANNVTLGDASTDTVQVNGYMGVGGAASGGISVYARNTALTGTSQVGFQSQITATSASTTGVYGLYVVNSTEAASFTVGNAYGVRVANLSLGAGSAATNQHGLHIADLTSATNNYGITSLVSSGTNKWNIYASGTAANYFAGNVGIGTTSPEYKLQVSGTTGQTFSIERVASSIGSSTSLGTIVGTGEIPTLTADGASIQFLGAGTWSATSAPGRIVFNTTPAATTTPVERFQLAAGEAVFNDPGNDYDFRVESDAQTHMLFVDAGNNKVRIGDDISTDGVLSVGIATESLVARIGGALTGSDGVDKYIRFQSKTSGGSNRYADLKLDVTNDRFDLYNPGPSGPTIPGISLLYAGGVVVNENGGDYDFRVESDNSTHMLFVDAGNNRVGIDTSTPYQRLHVSGAIESGTASSTNGSVVMYSTYNGASNDYISVWGTQFSSGGPTMAYGLASSGSTAWNSTYDNFSGSHSVLVLDGSNLRFLSDETSSATTVGSPVTVYERLALTSAEAVFNDNSRDVDFRVESDTNTHALFVDAGANAIGINDSSPTALLQLGMTGTANIANNVQTKVTDFAAANRFGTTGLTNNNDGIFFGMGVENGIPAGLGFMREASGWNTQIRFYTNNITSGPDSTEAMQEKMRIESSAIVINETGADQDFRVESDTNPYMLWVDASADGVNIGGYDTIQGQLNVINNTGSGNASTTSLYITTGNTYGTTTPKYLDLVFQGYRDGAGTGGGVKARLRAIERTQQSRSGTLVITTLDAAGDLQNNLELSSGEVVVNQDSIDMDFRVESDANTHMLFVDAGSSAVGIDCSTPQVRLQVGNQQGSGSNATYPGAIQINDNGGGGLNGSGGLEFKTASAGSGYGWKITSYDSFSTGVHFSIGNRVSSATWTQQFMLNQSGFCQIPFVYTYTTGSAANVFVDSAGTLYRSTSSLKYKKNVQDYTRGLADLLKLRPVFYEGTGPNDDGRQYAGLISEEVEAAGMTEFVDYGADGKPEGLYYQHMMALLVKSITELKSEFDAYKASHP